MTDGNIIGLPINEIHTEAGISAAADMPASV